jgi:hypothetical protein
VIIIKRLLDRTAAICHLASSQPQIESLTSADTDMMWTVVDYNAISKPTPAEFAVDDQFDHDQLPDANIWFESFFDTFSETNIGDFVSLDSLTDGSDLVSLEQMIRHQQ